MSRILYITPTGKANNHTSANTYLTFYALGIELRARLISTQLFLINCTRPKKLQNHIATNSYWIRALRKSIRNHNSSINKLRFLFAEESGLIKRSDTVNVIRTTKQDGDILVPIFLIDTAPRSRYSDRTEPHASSCRSHVGQQ
jgi:hypothetical protein